MPTNTTPGTSIDMSGAPGADISFDDLFPVEPQSTGPQSQPGTTPPVQPQAPVAAPPAPEFFLKGTKSVYKTPEDAIKGLDTKDDLIERYRSFLSTQGVDPNTLQPTKKPEPQAQPVNPDEKLFDDLSGAVGRGDKRGYAEVLRNYMAEQFAPVAPLMSEVARQRAVRQVSQEVPEFTSFISGDDYKQTLESLPRLKQAIEAAEGNLSMADSLGELYKITYLAAQGRRKPEPVVAAPVAAPVQSTPAARPTTSPSTMTPPQPSAPLDMRTSEGRKALIRDLEARGILDRQF